MKLSTFISLFLVIAAFMVIFGLMSQEAKNYYPSSNINDSEWYGKYNYVSTINDSTSKIQGALADIGDENKGWFVKIVSGIAAIPTAVISLATLILSSFGIGSAIIGGSFTTLGVTPILIVIIGVIIIVWGSLKLLEVYQRWPI
jgi:hypothetical protein